MSHQELGFSPQGPWRHKTVQTRGRPGHIRASRESTEQTQQRRSHEGQSRVGDAGDLGRVWSARGRGSRLPSSKAAKAVFGGKRMSPFPCPLQAPATSSWAQPGPHAISQSFRKWQFLYASSSLPSCVKFFMICFLTVRAPQMLAAARAFRGDSCGAAK